MPGKRHSTSGAATLRLVPPPKDPDPVAAALDGASPREAARALIAGYRAARNAFEQQMRESRAMAEHMLAGIEAWAEGGELPEHVRAFCVTADAANVSQIPPGCRGACNLDACAYCRVNDEYASYMTSFAYDDAALDLAILVGCDRRRRGARVMSHGLESVRADTERCDLSIDILDAASAAGEAAILRALGKPAEVLS